MSLQLRFLFRSLSTNLIFLFLSIIAFTSNAQYTPGNVFSSEDIALWLIADSNLVNTGALPANDGEEVAAWTGVGPNSFVASMGTQGPILRATGTADFNGHSVLEFSANTFLQIPDNNELDGGFAGLSIYMVFRRGATDTRCLLMKRTGTTTNRSYGLFYNTGFDIYGYFDNGNTIGGTVPIPVAGSQVASFVFDGAETGVNKLQLTLNGGASEQLNVTNTTVPNYSSDLLIGRFNPGDGRWMNGDQIAEIIILKTASNPAQRAIIENYLSAKYGSSIANDYYSGNALSYVVDLSGIGSHVDGSHDVSSSAGFYVQSAGNFGAGDYVLFGHNGSINSVVSTNLPAGVEARWSKDWYIEKTGGLNARLAFDLSEGINGKYPEELSNYTLLYRANTSGSYAEVPVLSKGVDNADQIFFSIEDMNLLDGYYTLASRDTANSSLIGAEGRSWYSLVSGNWDDWETWTLDPSGSLPNNPDSLTPTSSPTSPSDKVYILSGRTVTIQTGNDNKLNPYLLVDGRLDLQSSTGHNFGEIWGSGRILITGDNFPSGDPSHFVTAGQGEGTVEYYGAAYNLNSSRTYYNLEINLDNANDQINLLQDCQVNGSLIIRNGALMINNGSLLNSINLQVENNVEIGADGKLLTGNANAFHEINLYGDFINDGEVRLTNLGSPSYSSPATNGAIHLNFLHNSAHQSLYCNGLTNLYRIEIDKGVDKTYELEIIATAPSNFALMGPANQGHPSTAQLATNTNALGLLRGTVKIGSNVNIPVLNNTGNYNISESAQIWVNGGSVSKTAGTAVVPYGTVKVTAGSFVSTVSSGITLRDNGSIIIEGGNILTNQIRTSVLGPSNVGGYIQRGGTVTLAIGSEQADYYKFCLTFPGNVFQMTGGTLNILESGGRGGIFINSDPSNVHVTGGTVICNSRDANFNITSRAPFYNMRMINSSTPGTTHFLGDAVDVGTSDVNVSAQPLVVLNDLTIESNSSFDHDGVDVTIGGDFTVQANASYVFDNAKRNTTTINGSGNSLLSFLNVTGGTNDEQRFWKLVIDKPSNGVVSLESGKVNRDGNNNNLLRIDGTAFMLLGGTLDNGTHSVRFYTDTVVNYGTVGVYDRANAMPDATANGNNDLIKFRPDHFVMLTNDNSVFGNVRLNSGNRIVTLNSDVYIQRIQWRHGRMNLQTYNLKVDELYVDLNASQTIGGEPSVQDMFITDGNASDGGLTLYVPATGIDFTEGDNVFEFPLGIGTTNNEPASRYTPADITINGILDDGYITVNPVDGELLTTDLTGGDILSYYWRVRTTGFSTQPTVSIQYKYYDQDLDGSGNEASFVPGMVLDGNGYIRSFENDVNKVDDANNTITFNGAGSGFTLADANFTAGMPGRFVGSPDIYYTRFINGQRTWGTATNWRRGDPVTGPFEVPTVGSIVVIRASCRMNIYTASIAEPAEVIFDHDFVNYPDPDSENCGRLQFRVSGTYDIGKVKGTGMVSFNAPMNPNVTGDFGEFGTNPDSYYLYFGGAATLNNIPTPIPNLMIEGTAKNIDQNITVNTDLVIQGNNTTTALQDILIKRDLVLGFWVGGTFRFPNSGTGIRVEVEGNVDFTQYTGTGSDRNLIVQNSTSNIEHRLILHGDIIQGANDMYDLDLYNGVGRPNVVLELQGTGNHNYSRTSASVPQFYRIVMNKGTSRVNSFTFNQHFDLEGTANGATKALEMQNGTLIFDDPNISIDLNTGGDDFLIPGTSALHLNQGSAFVSGNNTGIRLDGLLQISGGTLDMISGPGNGNNYIEYSASGLAEINLSGGSLLVGSQVRRGLTSDIGDFKYSQSGGTARFGVLSNPESNRGVFEVIGNNSSFEHTGGDFTIVNAQSSASIASLYLDPNTYNIADGTAIQFGDGSTNNSQIIGVHSTIPLKNLSLDNTSGLNPSAKMWVVPLVLDEDLNIATSTSFNANGLDLSLAGDMNNAGTFVPNGNSTYFNGVADQQIVGSTNFYNLYKTTANTLSLNDLTATDLVVGNELILQAGTFNTNDNTVEVKGHCANNATHIYSSGVGILLNGSLQQELSGNGSFDKLTINNTNGVFVPLGNHLTITDVLRLENGVFNIGKNLLTVTANASIEAGNPFSETNMIQTNISFTDNGVRKIMPAGLSNFIYPMGSAGKYTPVSFTVNGNGNSTGSITVKPANEMHPSIIDDTETPSIVDADNVLHYHWVLKAVGMDNFSAEARMKYIESDLKVTAPYTDADYITVRLLADGSGNWNKFDNTKVDEANQILIFDFANTNDDGISGDYTAGIDDAVPDVVPLYQTLMTGTWPTETVWDPNVAGGPRGARARINNGHIITVPANYISSYSTEIYGTVRVNTTFGHRFGLVMGTGTIYSEREALPAGIYDNFFASTGGTLEFGGSLDYDILGGYSEINNLTLSGTGDRRLPNSDITLNGDLIINGAAALSLVNDNNRNLSINGDLSRVSGTFDAGTGTSAVRFVGNAAQSISGEFTGSNSFNRLSVENTSGISINSNIEIGNRLDLLNGAIRTGANSVRMPNTATISPSTGASNSYVDGLLIKEMLTNESFEFPVGDGNQKGNVEVQNLTNTSGLQDIEARYVFSSVPNVTSFSAPIKAVSITEHWEIEAPSGAQSKLMIRLDGSSDIANGTDLDSVRLVTWDGAAWVIVGGTLSITGDASAGTLTTSSPVTYSNSPQLFALASIQSVLNASATFSTVDQTICQGISVDLTVVLSGAKPFDFSYSDGASTYNVNNADTNIYTITVTPMSTTTYTLLSVSDQNGAGSIVGDNQVSIAVNPVPNPTLTGSLVVCEGQVGLVYSTEAGMNNYNWVVSGGGVITSGGTIIDNSSIILWSGVGAQSVSVNYENSFGCTSSVPASESITVQSAPTPTISGVDTLCEGASGLVYQTEAGMTSYLWAVTSEGSIVSGGTLTDNSATIDWDIFPIPTLSKSATLEVSYIDGNGCQAINPTEMQILIFRVPRTGPAYHVTNTHSP